MSQTIDSLVNPTDALAPIAESLSAISTQCDLIVVLLGCTVILSGLREIREFINW